MSGQDQEIHDLKAGVSCAAVLERQRWRLDKRASTRRCWKYRRGAGEVLIVNHEGRGWWDPTGDGKGDVVALLQFLEPGMTFGQAFRALRDLCGIAPTFPAAVAAKPRSAPDVPPARRWRARPPLSPGSSTSRYLAETRALEPTVLDAASRLDVVREGPRDSAWFAHRDADGAVVGIEMRGPDYRGFSAGGGKTLFQLRGHGPSGATPFTRLAVLEAPIDAMSLAGIEGLRTDTLYVATTGGMGPSTIEALQTSLRGLASYPESVLVAATDADAAGERIAANLLDLATAASVRCERMLPPDARKDWNEVAVARGQAASA